MRADEPGPSDLRGLVTVLERMTGVSNEAELAELCASSARSLLPAELAACITDQAAALSVPGNGDGKYGGLRPGLRALANVMARCLPAPGTTCPTSHGLHQLGAAELPPELTAALAADEVDSLLAAPLVIGPAGNPAGVLVAPPGADPVRTGLILRAIAHHAAARLAVLRADAAVAAGKASSAVPAPPLAGSAQPTEAHLIVNDRLATLGTLAGSIGHEIANPLASVLLNNSALSARLARADLPAGLLACAQRYLAENDEALDRIRAIVDELRFFVRKDDSVSEPLDLRAIVQSALRLARAPMRGLDVRLRLEAVGPVVGSATRLGQVFLNLLVNAGQAVATREHPLIEVSVVERDGEAVVSVHDNGPGITPEHLPRIFEIYFTTKASQGTGLGLAIARDIVTQHGGRIEVETTPGEGTTFRVFLPVRVCAKGTRPPERTIDPAVRPVRRQHPRPCQPPPDDRPRLLVVDDEPGILRALARDLDGYFRVATADCFREAERACAAEPVDVLLCDVNVQGQSGVDLAARLTAGCARLSDRVVYMTGGPIDARSRATFEQRPDRFVSKPFDLSSLVKILKDAASE